MRGRISCSWFVHMDPELSHLIHSSGPMRSKDHDLNSFPIPTPRNLSGLKGKRLDQYDCPVTLQEFSDSPATPSTSAHQTSCIPEAGEQNISSLAKELDYVRQTNKKLQDTLMSREKELETLRLDTEIREQAAQAMIAEKTAVLVEEVYRAQRERDEALMARLRLANEERDEALLRVQNFQLYLKELEDLNPEETDMTLQQLLAQLGEAEGGAAIQENGALILERIRQSQERREHITAEEMGAVIQERDAARAKCKQLEKELHLLQESKQTSMDFVTAEKSIEPSSKVSLTFLQQDKDKVNENYKKLEEELETLRVYYSLHQSLSQEASLKEQFSKAVSLYEEALRNREEALGITQRQNQELCHQLQQAQNQCAELQGSMRRATACQQESEDRIHKLERLVEVLRKKVGGGNVRTVV
uniref:Mirror-image polydactyly 1 n=2 Tax=Xenopus tropicalis TaxID=8364 RepID=A0A6I8ST88_XENTR